MQKPIIVLVFADYLGLGAAALPWFQVDRTASAPRRHRAPWHRDHHVDDIGGSIDVSTIVLLFALMIISAQFLSAGFYDLCAIG